MGGPSSGYAQAAVRSTHGKASTFKRSSPSPDRFFDVTRGACPEMNSYNNITQFMPSKSEKPRLTVLQNFKEINRIMTSTFIKNKSIEEKYGGNPPLEIAQRQQQEDAASEQMT